MFEKSSFNQVSDAYFNHIKFLHSCITIEEVKKIEPSRSNILRAAKSLDTLSFKLFSIMMGDEYFKHTLAIQKTFSKE